MLKILFDKWQANKYHVRRIIIIIFIYVKYFICSTYFWIEYYDVSHTYILCVCRSYMRDIKSEIVYMFNVVLDEML